MGTTEVGRIPPQRLEAEQATIGSMLLDREATTRAVDVSPRKTPTRNLAEIIVAKQRNSPTGSVELMWHKEYTCFENLERQAMAS